MIQQQVKNQRKKDVILGQRFAMATFVMSMLYIITEIFLCTREFVKEVLK
jgi:hypothetical protein